MSIEGKVAVVTGTSPNIGGGIALGLAARGVRVGCLDFIASNADQCAKDIRGHGGVAVGVDCDVTRPADVERAFAVVEAELGPVDILVNAAALVCRKGVINIELGEWSRQLEVILTGSLLCTKAALASMISSGTSGSVINVLSTAAHQGEPSNIGYATAKSGLLNFTRSVAMEVAHLGIRVNSITPTSTDPSEAIEREQRWGVAHPQFAARKPGFDATSHHVPMKELPAPSDYAAAIAFLVSDEARMVTGTDLKVDAGALARYWRWDPATSPGSEF